MRSRNIKPGLCENVHLGECSVRARYLFTCLPMVADRAGILVYEPRRIKAAIFPYDDFPSADIDSMVQELCKYGAEFVHVYEVDGVRYLWVVHFSRHQSPHCKE
jgi:hypothetical protein